MSKVEDDEISLSLEIESCGIDFNDMSNAPENTALFISYSELVMVFHNGRFCVETKDQWSAFKWIFPVLNN